MATKNLAFLTFLLLFAGILCQCESAAPTEEKEKVNANFYVRYLADALQLKGQATFFGSDSTALQIPGGVAFMGSGTQERELPGQLTRYETTLQTPYQTNSRFTFKLPQTESQKEVTVSMSALTDFEVTQASKSEGLVLALDGNLQKDETILLLFTDPKQEARTILRPGPLSKKDLLIPADALLHFEAGEYRLYLVKQSEQNVVGDELDYSFTVEYYTAEKSFTLTD